MENLPNKPPVGLSSNDLKSKIFESMQSAGVMQNLKSQLRHRMVSELRGKQRRRKGAQEDMSRSDLLAATIRHKRDGCWTQKAIDNLVLDHLKRSRYHYSVSLFQQESGLKKYSQTLTEELLSRLGLKKSDVEFVPNDSSASSTSSESIPPNAHSSPKQQQKYWLLWEILEKLSLNSAPLDNSLRPLQSSNQQEKPGRSQSLADKLRAIDESLAFSHGGASKKPKDPEVTISALTAAVRRAEEHAERRWRLDFEQWKALELTKTRQEEASKANIKIDERFKQLEKEFTQRKVALDLREKNAIDRLNHHRDMLESEIHGKRQNLLNELEKIKGREEILTQQEQLMRDMEAVKMKELDMLKTATLRPHKVCPSAVNNWKETSTEAPATSSNREEAVANPHMQSLINQLEQQTNENKLLTSELSSMKNEMRQLLVNRGTAVVENDGLRVKVAELERTLDKVMSQSSRRSPVCKSSNVSLNNPPEDKWRQEINSLRSSREEAEARQRHLEETIRNMQKTLEAVGRNEQMRNSSQVPPRSQRQVSFANTSQMFNHQPPSHHSEHPSSHGDPLRDYEPVETGSVLPNLAECDVEEENLTTAFLRTDVRKRLRDLEEESSALQEDYNRYMHTNYRQLLEAQCKSRIKRPTYDHRLSPSKHVPVSNEMKSLNHFMTTEKKPILTVPRLTTAPTETAFDGIPANTTLTENIIPVTTPHSVAKSLFDHSDNLPAAGITENVETVDDVRPPWHEKPVPYEPIPKPRQDVDAVATAVQVEPDVSKSFQQPEPKARKAAQTFAQPSSALPPISHPNTRLPPLKGQITSPQTETPGVETEIDRKAPSVPGTDYHDHIPSPVDKDMRISSRADLVVSPDLNEEISLSLSQPPISSQSSDQDERGDKELDVLHASSASVPAVPNNPVADVERSPDSSISSDSSSPRAAVNEQTPAPLQASSNKMDPVPVKTYNESRAGHDSSEPSTSLPHLESSKPMQRNISQGDTSSSSSIPESISTEAKDSIGPAHDKKMATPAPESNSYSDDFSDEHKPHKDRDIDAKKDVSEIVIKDDADIAALLKQLDRSQPSLDTDTDDGRDHHLVEEVKRDAFDPQLSEEKQPMRGVFEQSSSESSIEDAAGKLSDVEYDVSDDGW